MLKKKKKRCYQKSASSPEFLSENFKLGSREASSDVRQVIVELAQVVVVSLIVHSWKDAAAGQLRQILERKFQGQFESSEVFLHACTNLICFVTAFLKRFTPQNTFSSLCNTMYHTLVEKSYS